MTVADTAESFVMRSWPFGLWLKIFSIRYIFKGITATGGMSSGRIVVYGGKGALGSVIVDYFKKKNFVSDSFNIKLDFIPYKLFNHIKKFFIA
uniref:Epimerase domain-containing protein n=1 Tax=Ascaris lumbricoides TaxID=6252 RepID=A0A0M3HGL9_ASCLU